VSGRKANPRLSLSADHGGWFEQPDVFNHGNCAGKGSLAAHCIAKGVSIHMKRSQFTSRIRSLALGLALPGLVWMLPGTAGAQAQTRVAGEVSAARQASLNGVTVRSSGTTVFNNSRLTTGDRGSAAISLGRRGRVELGAKTELLLQFAQGQVGGELRAGKLVLSVPSGVQLALTTAKGVIKSSGLQPTVISVESSATQTKVIAHLGEAQLVAGGKTETVRPGEEVALGSQGSGAGLQRRQVVAASLLGTGGAAGAAASAQVAGRAAQPVALAARPASATFSSLLSTGLNFSLAQLAGRTVRDPDQYFDTTVVCRDSENFFCRRRSTVNP
jgi:hypothetical protein